MTNFDIEDFQTTLGNEDVMDCSDTQGIDDMFNIFQAKLLKDIDKHPPFKTLSKKEIKMRKKHGSRNKYSQILRKKIKT